MFGLFFSFPFFSIILSESVYSKLYIILALLNSNDYLAIDNLAIVIENKSIICTKKQTF